MARSRRDADEEVVVTTVRFPCWLLRELEKYAKDNAVSVSVALRQAAVNLVRNKKS